ncbi:hypothetical protein [Cupriavidus sp. SK-3]|uniref:hypothetical protein n=1 Tax=Cupriavidus sp. SK-3 TaxID=1470558 RepID=UPI001268298A|nr:hypothetical protein [Cupriavidus sp. SK-3]
MAKISPQTWVLHPRPDEHSKPFKIHESSTPTGPESWVGPESIALWTLDSAVPSELHGVWRWCLLARWLPT